MLNGVPGLLVSAPGAGGGLILHFHGGGYQLGSSTSHAGLAAEIARQSSATVFVPDYRLAPEHPFPAAYDDGVAVYHAIREQYPDTPVALCGDSAGGGLAMAVLLAVRDANLTMPAAVVLLSPWADLTLGSDSLRAREANDTRLTRQLLAQMAADYLQDADASDRRASPLLADLDNLPPVLVQVGTGDILEDDSVRVVEALRRAGGRATLEVSYRMPHVFHRYCSLSEEGHAALKRLGRFLRAHIDVSED
ncbi:alpha/beta hydrolase [Mycobacterium sp. NPDC003449]